MTIRQIPPSFIPPLLPNQTIYSWGAMFHEMSGNATVEESLVQTFALTRKGLHFHIPSHLEALCANTQLALGAAEDIVKIATTLPYYTKFRSPDVARSIMGLVRSNGSHGVAQALGMAKTRSNAHPPRRSCYQCLKDDINTFGLAYWHRDHQLSGVMACQIHGTPLLSLPYDHDSNHSGTFIWPREDWERMDIGASPDFSMSTLVTLRRLAKLAADMCKGDLEGGYSIRQMRNTCLPMLNERKLIAQDGSLMVVEALQAYGSHFSSVAAVPEISSAIQSSIRPLIYALKLSGRYVSPLEWMLIIDWLFGGWAAFEMQYQQVVKDPIIIEEK